MKDESKTRDGRDSLLLGDRSLSSFILHPSSFLRRHWFLLVLVAGVSLAVARPDWLRPLTAQVPPRGVVAAALFIMAWGLESRSLGRAALRPLPALWAVLVSYGVLPALGWLAGRLVTETDYRIGLLIMTSVPCTLASAALWTRMAGGSEATALLVTLLTTATSWLATTAWLTWTTGAAVGVDSAAMMRELLVILVLPVALGQLARASPPLVRLAHRCRTVLGVVSRLLIFSIIVKAAVDVATRLAARTDLPSPALLLGTAGLCAGVHLIALFAGLWGGQALRFDRPSRIAIAFAGSQKTLPVALLLFETYFKEAHPLAVVPIMFYPLGQLVLDTFIAERLARRGAAGR
ncbi:MAG TPA: bile acid:sodium symporter [Gemmataceae bacterium]|jgi:sodium/bile acid cotransporter 7